MEDTVYRNICSKSVILALFASTAAHPAFAQIAEGEDPVVSGEGESVARMKEVVVTARKRAESLQDIPIAVTALSSDQLDDAGVNNVVEIAYSVPNLSLQDRGGSFGTSFGIRGISSNVRNAGIEDSVGLYVDGVYIGRPQFYRIDTQDIDQIEVLRGPQGTLFGKNTIAGALNVRTKAPNRDEFEGRVQASYGNFETSRLGGFVSGPIGDSVAAKLTLAKNDSDGWITNGFNGDKLQTIDDVFARGTVVVDLAESLTFTGSLDYAEADNKTVFGQPIFIAPGSATEEQIGNQIGDPQRVFRDGPASDETESLGISGQLEYEGESGYNIALIASARSLDFFAQFDDDNTARNRSNSRFRDSADQESVELRFVSPSFERWDFVTGVMYHQQEVVSDRDTGPLPPGDGPVEAFALINGDGFVETESLGVYLHGNYRLTDRLTLDFGARYSTDKKTGAWEQVTNDAIADLGFIPDDVSVPHTSERWDEVTPSIGLSYEFNDDAMAYAKYSSGFKSGSMLPDIINISSPEDFILEPETVDNYEIGVKTTLLDNRLRFNAAAFLMDYDNLQVINLLGTGFIGSNAGSVELTGLEVEVQASLTDRLDLSFVAGTLEGEYEDLVRADVDLTGNRPRNAPKLTSRVELNHFFPLRSGGEIRTNLNAAYRSKVYYDPENTEAFAQDAYTLINGRIGYQAEANWSVFLWGKNLTDEEYANFGRGGPFGQQQLAFAAPRTYGIEFNLDF